MSSCRKAKRQPTFCGNNGWKKKYMWRNCVYAAFISLFTKTKRITITTMANHGNFHFSFLIIQLKRNRLHSLTSISCFGPSEKKTRPCEWRGEREKCSENQSEDNASEKKTMSKANKSQLQLKTDKNAAATTTKSTASREKRKWHAKLIASTTRKYI